MKDGGGKGKAYLFIAQNGRFLYTVDCGARSDVFSAHAGTCTVHAIYEDSLYLLCDLYGILKVVRAFEASFASAFINK
jgi:hypothetical protein